MQVAERAVHYYIGGYALCRAAPDEDGTITISWSKNHITCLKCQELLGSNGRDKPKEGKT